MHLRQIVPSLETRHGGPSQSVRALANQLAFGGDDVELLATQEPGDSAASAGDRATLRLFPRLPPRAIARSPELRAHLLGTGADCCHHHSLWLRTLAYTAEAAQRHACPFVISPRGMMTEWAWNHRRLRKQFAEWFVHPGAFRQAAGWHATSREEAGDIRRLGFTQPVCIAPNGVDLPAPEALAAARAAWRVLCPAAAGGRPVAVFYSRLHRKKRVRELIDLWLSAPRHDWLLLVVGTAEDYSAAELSAGIAARGAAKRITVLDGAGQPPPYAVANLFLLPSHSENFGLVIAEALAAGVPALVTSTTPWTGLSGAAAGWCVTWEDYPRALAEALALNPGELAACGSRGREWMAQDFSWADVARRLREFYGSLKR